MAKEIVLPTALNDRRHIYNQFVIRTNRRDELITHLKNHKIGNEIYYPVPMHEQDCFANLEYEVKAFPASRCAAHTTIALPIYPELPSQSVVQVVRVLGLFYGM